MSISLRRVRPVAILPVIVAAAFLISPVPAAAAPLAVTPIAAEGTTPSTLVQTLVGDGITNTSGISYTGADAASGTFSGGADVVGFASGVVMTSGNATNVVGPNSSDSIGADNVGGSDADLEALGAGTTDAAVLEFDFTPSESPIFFRYVFASDEYNEFANSAYNDVFAFFVNGSNCALVPDTSTPVSVNTINGGNPLGTDPQNAQYFINNDTTDIPNAGLHTEMDGLTTVLTCQANVNVGVPNHLKLAIADRTDSAYDSAVFLEANSFSTTPPAAVPGAPTLNQALAGNGEVGLNWSAPDNTGTSPITKYTVYACPSGGGDCIVLDNVSPNPNSGSTFNYVIGGLTNGTTYSFTVTASNDNGEGPPSNALSATPNGSADTDTIGANGRGTVDTGLAGGANSSDPSCATDPSSPNCKNIVARYSLVDKKNAGAVIGLASVPDSQIPPAERIKCLEFEFAINTVAASPDCETVADKTLLSTYPTNVATLVKPHFAFEQNDTTVTTLELGAPCFQLVTNANGTPKLATNGDPICKNPNFPSVFGPGPIKTNMCPDGTGWTAAKPCAYVYYKVERIDGYDLSPADCATTWPNCTWGTLANPKARRPVQCPSGPTCGKEVIIGSTIVAGIKLASGQYAVRPWCQGSWNEGEPPPSNIKWLPCDLLVVWINFVKSSSVHFRDVLWTDLEVNDPGGKRTG